MCYPSINESQRGADRDNLGASAKQRQNDGSREAELRTLWGVCDWSIALILVMW